MTRLEAMADRIELRALVDRYAVAADTRDRAAFAAVFAPDGVLAVSTVELEGHDAVVTPLDYLDEHYPQTMHFVGNHDVVLDGDTAHGTVYCLAHHVTSEGDGMCDTYMAIRYVDDYRRADTGWLITRRHVNIDWLEDRPAYHLA